MPILELSEEDYQFLVQCKEELNNQDNRCTANPIWFCEYPDRSYGEYKDDYHCDGYIWLNYDHTESYENNEELFEYLSSCLDQENYDALKELYNFDVKDMDKKLEIKTWFCNIITDDDWYTNSILYDIFIDRCVDMMEDMDFNLDRIQFLKHYTRIGYNEEQHRICESGLFSLFSSDAEEHKKLDGHNYRKGQYDFVGSIQRSPKMLKLREMLMNLNLDKKDN